MVLIVVSFLYSLMKSLCSPYSFILVYVFFVILFALSLLWLLFRYSFYSLVIPPARSRKSTSRKSTSARHHFKLSPTSLPRLSERRSYEPKVMISILFFFRPVDATTNILFFYRVLTPYEALRMRGQPPFLTILKRNDVDCVPVVLYFTRFLLKRF